MLSLVIVKLSGHRFHCRVDFGPPHICVKLSGQGFHRRVDFGPPHICLKLSGHRFHRSDTRIFSRLNQPISEVLL